MPIMPVAVTDINVEKIIPEKFRETGSPAKIPLLQKGSFTATLVPGGVNVNNLGTQPFLPWAVFEEALSLIVNNGGKAERGDAMQSRLGDPKLPLNSIEGHIAHTIYQKSVGDSVFRRITPIACILIWAGICIHKPGELAFLEN
jgi:hypothetical protein